MAGKRTASSDLNHDNWDRDEEPEQPGLFQRATEDQLRARVMKTARRRNPISSVRSQEETSKPSVFSSFTGFSKPPTTPTSNVFAFLSNITTQSGQSKTNGFPENITKLAPNTSVTPSTTVDTDKKTQNYFSKLKGLNESVSNWIKSHVDTNPLIDLQPIFRDYEKYMKEIEAEKESTEASDKKQETSAPVMSSFVFKPAENVPDSTTEKDKQDGGKGEQDKVVPSFSFGTSVAASTPSMSIPTFNFGSNVPISTYNKFSFGANSTASTLTIPSTFSFGSTTSTSSGLSFSKGSPPLVLSGTKPTSSEKEGDKKTEDDEEDEPAPEPQLAKVVESDHIYTTRCKVFKKKDDKYIVCGVGDLYVKPIENSEKVQVIVRADNNLGTLLCNFVLSSSIPTKKMGTKDVMLVCLMTPDVKPPPVPIIIRVKTSEEADKLLEVLEKHKK